MKTEVNPQDTKRAEAFKLWMSSPMPMVTLTKTFDVSNPIKVSRKAGVKFNALLCWCIGKAATQTEEFYILHDDYWIFSILMPQGWAFTFSISSSERSTDHWVET